MPSMSLHASRMWRLGDGTPRPGAAGFPVKLGRALVVSALRWAAVADGPSCRERAALVLALLWMAKDVQVGAVAAGRL
ncbi:hypothetical protein K353_00838 [Kitasatospora sp. SolWspMP-SS2h]|nr:hypothetical protein K353_00838 [Kitasatospora sp. SolWspMP-SS2h]